MEYVALFTPLIEDQPCSWPAVKGAVFWEKCSEDVSCTSGKPKRSGKKYLHVS